MRRETRGRDGRLYLSRLANIIQKLDVFPRRLRPRMLGLGGADIHPSVRIQKAVDILPGSLRIGAGSYINTGTLLDPTAPIVMGSNVFIGPRVNVITAGHHIGDSTMRAAGHAPAPITIEDGTWIGAAATILGGVTVARGCIVAAGALVHRDTLPNGLYAGVPAARIRDLAD